MDTLNYPVAKRVRPYSRSHSMSPLREDFSKKERINEPHETEKKFRINFSKLLEQREIIELLEKQTEVEATLIAQVYPPGEARVRAQFTSDPKMRDIRHALPASADATDYTLTFKSKPNSNELQKHRTLDRIEIETPLVDTNNPKADPQKVFQSVWEKCEGRRLHKFRLYLPLAIFGSHVKTGLPSHKKFIELDIFLGDLKGLVIAEMEFSDVTRALGIDFGQLPEWLIEMGPEELEAAGNSNLSQNGIPKVLATKSEIEENSRLVDMFLRSTYLKDFLNEFNAVHPEFACKG